MAAARKQRAQPAGPKALSGSAEAKRKSAIILEALCGLRTTQSASDELGIALMRYYVLETRMLQGMINALEPRARGKQRSVAAEMKVLQDDRSRLEREVFRLQALYRMTQRAVGVQPDKKPDAKAVKAKKTRRVRRQSRGERVLASLRSGGDLSGADRSMDTMPSTNAEPGGS